MARSTATDRLQRLEMLKALLKSADPMTVQDVAEELGVSMRTVSRDIELLREQGVPIDADRGRGGGLRLHPHWGIGRVQLNYSEAVDLLISLAVAEQMRSPLFMAHLDGIRRKLTASFAPSMKHRVAELKARIRIAEPASPRILSAFETPSRQIVEPLHQAFLMQRRITVTYRAQDGDQTQRTLEPHYLMLSYPIWYVLAWDLLRNDVRTFRCDRFESLKTQPEDFRLLAIERFAGALEGVHAI